MQRVDALLMQDWGGTESEHIAFRRPSMRAESKTASAAARHQERCGCARESKHTRVSPFLSLVSRVIFLFLTFGSLCLYML